METFDFGRKKIVSVIFDLSLQHESGKRIIDILKKDLVEIVVEKDEELLFFVASKNNNFPKGCGESIQQIDSYIEPPDFNLSHTFRRSISNITNTVEDVDKVLLLITNRFDEKYKGHYKSLFDMKKYKKAEYDVCFVEIHENSKILEAICLSNSGNYKSLKSATDLKKTLVEFGVM
jgi:hypothetical protein